MSTQKFAHAYSAEGLEPVLAKSSRRALEMYFRGLSDSGAVASYVTQQAGGEIVARFNLSPNRKDDTKLILGIRQTLQELGMHPGPA